MRHAKDPAKTRKTAPKSVPLQTTLPDVPAPLLVVEKTIAATCTSDEDKAFVQPIATHEAIIIREDRPDHAPPVDRLGDDYMTHPEVYAAPLDETEMLRQQLLQELL